MNIKFQNALKRVEQNVPPVWFMRQAGRYHQHYQKLKEKYSFMELCKNPELAAEVALGPVQDFDFDLAILFSDLLFPLEAMGMGLSYPGTGPELGWHLSESNIKKLKPLDDAIEGLLFQREAMRLTRQVLPKDKSLIGFVGGPWTLFTYAVQGKHDGALIESKKHMHLFKPFCDHLVPLLIENIKLQFEGGAEVVMLFDTAAGEVSPAIFNDLVVPQLSLLAQTFKGKLGYYSKVTGPDHLSAGLFSDGSFAGLGVDHRWDLSKFLKTRKSGFVQGNFDQALLFADVDNFKKQLNQYLKPLKNLTPAERAGWVCGLGHGVLPKTPEAHVRLLIDTVRETFA